MKGFDRYTPNSEMALFYLHLTTRMIRVIRRVCWGKRIISFTTRDFPLKIKHFQTKKTSRRPGTNLYLFCHGNLGFA